MSGWDPSFPAGMLIASYGLPPTDISPRLVPHQPDHLPDRWVMDTRRLPAIPAPDLTDATEIAAKVKARIAWLERELRMQEAWKLELETLRRMLAAFERDPK